MVLGPWAKPAYVTSFLQAYNAHDRIPDFRRFSSLGDWALQLSCSNPNFQPQVSTLYKRKADKVKPSDATENDGDTPGGDPLWLEKAIAEEKRLSYNKPKSYFDKFITLKFSALVTGSRLTPERLPTLVIREEL